MDYLCFLLFSVFSFVFSNKPTAIILLFILRKAPIKKTKENTENKRKPWKLAYYNLRNLYKLYLLKEIKNDFVELFASLHVAHVSAIGDDEEL